MSNLFVTLLFISFGGILGAETRYWVTGKLKNYQPLPYGTLFVNVTGSIGLGFFVIFANAILLQAQLISMIGTGFFGCYTTMSSFAAETMTLQEQSMRLALINIVLMLSAVLVGALLGHYTAIVLT